MNFITEYFRKKKLKKVFKRWKADMGDDRLRLDYDLTPDSLVFDIGGYHGEFAEKIYSRYECRVYIFEPHPKYFKQCVTRFKDNAKVAVFNYGLSDSDGIFNLSDDNDASSFNENAKDKNNIQCEVKDVAKVLKEMEIHNIDLMKINVEGSEYPLLARLAECDLLHLTNNYQIQFHNFIKNAKQLRSKIRSALEKTHKQDWCYDFIWENWSRK